MAFHQASSSSSSSSASSSRWDVFLSFRGKDTRKNFTAHLCTTMRQKGIHTFMDDKLKSGEKISPELVKAIEGSKISIIVLSKNYASSRWCLDELMKILDCRTRGQQVLPLFYDVNPSEVRHTTHTVGEAFAKLEKRYKDDKKKVNKWKTALKEVADLSGKDLENFRNEPEFIREIIVWVNSILVKKTHFQVAQYPIRIESRVEDLKPLLNIEKNDGVYMVGIFGTGGIGKTTIAKAVYNSIASQFQHSCFLGNIRETSLQTGGLVRLQKELLSKILEESSLMVNHVDEGITLIKARLHNLRVLLVLDDVDQLDQLEKLAGKDDWFGLGSRIVITTRDKHVLIAHGIHLTYPVKELEDNEALQLFSWHAFKRDKPNDDFVEHTKHAISYAGGLPLALVVLGSDLFGKGLREWESALDRYKRFPNNKIQEILRISYDGLANNIKDIFLDIACFFKGQELGYVSKILDKCGFFPDDGIKVLEDKSLISIADQKYPPKFWPSTKPYKTLEMHDLLQEIGREIVQQKSPKDPSKRSRLWFHEDVCRVLEGNMETNNVEGILIDLPEHDLKHLNSEAFKKMNSLRLFINYNASFFEEPTFLSNELRLIDWANYPGESFPANFHGKNLVVLRMPKSDIKELEGLQKFQNLTTMNFSRCRFLEKIPDVSMTSNLESLVLDYCENLVEVHHSVGFLDKLVLLSVKGCYSLSSFPTCLELRSLESLFVSWCPNLKNFPEIKCQMKCLKLIEFYCTGIKEMPSSIKYLVRIKELDLGGCSNLMHLPDSIDQLQHLEILNLRECDQLLDILRLPPNVVEVQAGWCTSLAKFLEDQLLNTWDPPERVGIRTASRALQLSNLGNNVVKESPALPDRSSLRSLDLSASAIVSLPAWLNKFVGLEELYLDGCGQLEEIPELPPNIREVDLKGCTSLKRFQFNNLKDLPMLQWIDFSQCDGLLENMGDDLQIGLMSGGHAKDHAFSCLFPGNKILDCFKFNHCKKDLCAASCEIDINEPLHLDSENTRFVFFAVISPDYPYSSDAFNIHVEVINNGQPIDFHTSRDISNLGYSDHVYLHYSGSHHSQLKMDNLRVLFTLDTAVAYFNSCGFHLEHRYEEKAICTMDGVQLPMKRRRDDGDGDDSNRESNWYPQHPCDGLYQHGTCFCTPPIAEEFQM